MGALIGIPVAVVAAALLALGAQLQNQGASRVDDEQDASGSGFGIQQLLALASTPRWLGGSTILGLAVVLQLVSLVFAPIAVVQPIGALALVITVLLDTRMNRARIPRPAITAIALCVLGVTVFVGTASLTTTSASPRPVQILLVLGVLAVVLVATGGLFLALRKRRSALLFALGAGVLFGFVATLAKIVVGRVAQVVRSGSGFSGQDLLLVLCVVALAAAGAFGLYLVQTAYASGSPDLVVAALTVIDPLVAVTIGIAVLGEAAHAPGWAFVVFGVAEVVAVIGVLRLARHQPEAGTRDEDARQEAHG